MRMRSFLLKLRANFTGGSIEEMIGEINVDSLEFTAPDKEYFMKNMNIRATKKNDRKPIEADF